MEAYIYWGVGGMGRNLWGDEYPHPPGFAPLIERVSDLVCWLTAIIINQHYLQIDFKFLQNE